jgi:hypothetical protein
VSPTIIEVRNRYDWTKENQVKWAQRHKNGKSYKKKRIKEKEFEEMRKGEIENA